MVVCSTVVLLSNGQVESHLSSWLVVAVLSLMPRGDQICPGLELSWEEFGCWDCGGMCVNEHWGTWLVMVKWSL